MVEKDTVTFNGITFVRYPLARTRAARVYYTAQENGDILKGVGQLHVEVWKAANGQDEVPPGHVIHHRDFNPLNNDQANLQCVTRKEHAKLHEHERDLDSPEWLAHLERIRPLAAEWHRSEEGRAWHRAHGRGTWVGRERWTRTCNQCGQEYEAAFKRSRYCSRACIQRAIREEGRYRGRYEVEATCQVCGKAFNTSKYHPARTCSPRCAATWRRRERQR